MNRIGMLSFLQLFKSHEINSKFNGLQLLVKQFLQRVHTADVPVAREVEAKMEKAMHRKLYLKVAHSLRHVSIRLRELDAEQICQLLQKSFAVYTYALKDSHV